MNYKKFKKYYSVDKAEYRWGNIMNFIILFLSMAVLSATLIFLYFNQNIKKDPLPKLETDLQKIQSIQNRFEEINIF